MTREFQLSNVDNFRDFGGFQTMGGRTARRGLLLRSGHLGAASPEDLAALAAAPVSVIVDLRRPNERRKLPGRRPPDFGGLVIESDDGDLGEAPHLEFLRQGDLSPSAVEAFLAAYYRAAPFLPRHADLFARAFAALAETDGAVLIHCTAGKDRTGLLAALIRTAIGGRFEDSLADFARTNSVTLTPERVARERPALEALIGGPADETVVQGFLGVWPRHLEAAFEEIRRRAGSVDAYLAELGVDDGRRRRLVDRLIA